MPSPKGGMVHCPSSLFPHATAAPWLLSSSSSSRSTVCSQPAETMAKEWTNIKNKLLKNAKSWANSFESSTKLSQLLCLKHRLGVEIRPRDDETLKHSSWTIHWKTHQESKWVTNSLGELGSTARHMLLGTVARFFSMEDVWVTRPKHIKQGSVSVNH